MPREVNRATYLLDSPLPGDIDAVARLRELMVVKALRRDDELEPSRRLGRPQAQETPPKRGMLNRSTSRSGSFHSLGNCRRVTSSLGFACSGCAGSPALSSGRGHGCLNCDWGTKRQRQPKVCWWGCRAHSRLCWRQRSQPNLCFLRPRG